MPGGTGTNWRRWSTRACGLPMAMIVLTPTFGQPPPKTASRSVAADVLTAAEWRRVDSAAAKALVWLASQQRDDGSFTTLEIGQPGVTSLCVLAFMLHGEMPGQGKHGERLDRATDFIVGCQKHNGLVALLAPDEPEIPRYVYHDFGAAAAYNHGISSLAMADLYGVTEGGRASRLWSAIEKSLRASQLMQRWPKDRAIDEGGWRYLNDFNQEDSDLSVTGWELKFLCSARNAGFDVPKRSIDAAGGYVQRTYSERYGAFGYAGGDHYDFRSGGMASAGILALAHASYHKSPEVQRSGRWILEYGFGNYNQVIGFYRGWPNDHYHYGLFNCCQGIYQLGGEFWEQFYLPDVKTLLANQQLDASWPPESHFHDGQFGSAYTTALVMLTLGAPNDFLPIYQR